MDTINIINWYPNINTAALNPALHIKGDSGVRPTHPVMALDIKAVVVPVMAKTHMIRKNCLPSTFHLFFNFSNMERKDRRKQLWFYT